MLKKTERLSRTDFNSFFKAGRRHNTEHVTIIYSPHSSFHASVVVGKKVHKHAVVRNTLRRRVYGQLYALKTSNHKGVFIVLLKPSFNSLTKAVGRAHLQSLIERIAKPA